MSTALEQTPMESAWFTELDGAPVILSKQQEADAIRRAQGGDKEAADMLIRSQLRWIIGLAKTVAHPAEVTLEELVGVGVVEFWRATAKIDVARSVRLSSFCEQTIRRAMWRYVQGNDNLIYVPPKPGGGVLRSDALNRVRVGSIAPILRAQNGAPKASDAARRAALAVANAAPVAMAGDEASAARMSHLFSVAGLSAEQRAALLSRFAAGEGLTPFDAIAVELGVPEQEARRLVNGALARLRKFKSVAKPQARLAIRKNGAA